MKVISQDDNRVQILEKIVIKKSDYKELANLKKATDMVNNFEQISLEEQDYKIKIPDIYKYENDEIYMERCYGDNLEILLRQKETHKRGVVILNKLLIFNIKNKFYWKDFAPRNIMIDDDTNTIYFFDFERGIENQNIDVSTYLQGIVYEEYGAFLLPEERIFQIDDIYGNQSDNNAEEIAVDDIESKRVRTILQKLRRGNFVTFEQYIKILKMILINEQPYIENKEFVFPLIELEEYVVNNLYEKYAEKVIGGYYGKIV